VQRFTPEFIEAARPARHAPGNRWFVDETCLKVAGKWTYLYRAVDQHGQVIDAMMSAKRGLTAARRFFTRALRTGTIPAEVSTGQRGSPPPVTRSCRICAAATTTSELRASPPATGSASPLTTLQLPSDPRRVQVIMP
jgi:transposase-like protein